MTRPAGDAEQKLIEAGKAILAEEGFSGLSVRAVAAKAGVNLGLVSYHFGGKEAYVRRVAEELYEDFFRDFSLQVEEEIDPLVALRKGLLKLGFFVRDHRSLIQGLMRDMGSGEEEAKTFVATNFPRHGVILAGLVRRCQADGRILDLPTPAVMTTVMGMVAFPSLMAEPLARMKMDVKGFPNRKAIEQSLLSDSAVELRVDLALKAFRP
jgi:AcrR family transcriptional regulator